MKLPFKIIWRDSEEDLREERQEERIRDLEHKVAMLEDQALLWRPSRTIFKSNRYPVRGVVEAILQHLKLDIHMTPRKEASLSLKSTESPTPTADSVSGP